jgi:hypothetical protein
VSLQSLAMGGHWCHYNHFLRVVIGVITISKTDLSYPRFISALYLLFLLQSTNNNILFIPFYMYINSGTVVVVIV